MFNGTSLSRTSINVVVPRNTMIAMLSHCQNLSQDSPSEPKFTLKITTVTGKSGVVKSKVAPRSYLVEVNGRSYRRNRVHVRDSLQSKTPVQTPGAVPDVTTAENTQIEQLMAPAVQCKQNQVLSPIASPTRATSTPWCTKSGRISRPPAKYNDFV